jgi:translation initiation factor 2B subunit (eIF-2B alpha/beta/delta family)
VSFEWDKQIRALAADHRSPGSALATHAMELLREVAERDPEMLAETARALVLAQPALAAVANAANVTLRAVEVLGFASVPRALEALQLGVDADRRAAAAALVERLDAPVRLVTISASASVVEGIQALSREGLLVGVVCAESRPLLEGTALARWLVEQGTSTTLVPDAGLCEHLVPGSIFVVGTEAILPGHVVAKLGTRAGAAWARLAAVPRYVLATRDKLYPRQLVGCFANPSRPASDLLRAPPAALHVDNRAFDCTAREMWNEVFVGRNPLHVAEQAGDHVLARGLQQLSGTAG